MSVGVGRDGITISCEKETHEETQVAGDTRLTPRDQVLSEKVETQEVIQQSQTLSHTCDNSGDCECQRDTDSSKQITVLGTVPPALIL